MPAIAKIPATRLSPTFDVQKIRADFPLLKTNSNGRPLIYLDNGATTQKPQQVIDAIAGYYESQNANIHRGVYQLSQNATHLYDRTRTQVARFLNAAREKEIIFTRGTTESINLVASSYGRAFLKPGDEIVISAMEHHSNIVPWQIVCQQTGAKLRVIPMNDAGELLIDEYKTLLNEKTKFVSIVHVSNSLGTVNDVKTIAELAHAVGAKVLVDGAQWVAHSPTDVRDLDVDFYAFSSHKLFGPTGVGVLYGRADLLEKMPPYQSGGDMIESVTFEKTTYAPLPAKFEAGTPNIAGVVGLGVAIDYVQSIGFEQLHAHEQGLLKYATEQLQSIPRLRIIGTATNKASVISFVIENPPIASFDIGMALDRDGIAVRTGHHCCQPVMDRLNISSTSRASLAMYNTRDDIDALTASIQKLISTTAPAESPAAPPRDPRDSQQPPKIFYPQPTTASSRAAADNLAASFELFEDREARAEYVLELSRKLPRNFDLLKQVTPRIPGCMSEVYLVARKTPGSIDCLEFVADANADIVRGLIVILQQLFSGQRTADILNFDVESFFNQIGLDQFISSQRRNGLAGMINRLRNEAELIEKRPAK